MIFQDFKTGMMVCAGGILLLGFTAGCTGNNLPAAQEYTQAPSVTPEQIVTAAEPAPTKMKETSTSQENGQQEFEAELVWVPAGEFVMGADPQTGYEICLDSRQGCELEDFGDEAPPHSVFLQDYWIYTYEVTNIQYRVCVEDEGCAEPVFMEFYNNEYYADHPVVHVDWFAAAQFCEWAGGRLPTEAEWEKAARGSTGWNFPWGDEAECSKANFSGCNFGEVTLPVGSYPDGASVYGAMDMSGNAAEWVSDWYDPTYYAFSSYENPTGPETGELRGARGGSWKNPAVGIRSTNRGGNYPEVYSSGVGFRCVMDKE